MKKNLIHAILLFGVAFSSQVWAAAKAPVPLTAVVVPAHYTPVQIGMDMAERYPAVLISYQQGAEGQTALHAWSGKRWIPVGTDDFAQASFFKMTPSRVLVVGEDNSALELIDLAEGWAPQVFNLASEKSSDMVNTLGQLFEFNSGEWKWFARRYSMDIQDLNKDRRGTSWYDQPYVDERRSGVTGVIVEPYEQQGPTAYAEEIPAEVDELVPEVYSPPAPTPVLPAAQISTQIEVSPAPMPLRSATPAVPAFRGWSESATAGDVPSK